MDKPFIPYHDFLTLLSDQMLTAQKITSSDSRKRDLIVAPETSPLDQTFEFIVESDFERARRAGKCDQSIDPQAQRPNDSRPWWQREGGGL